MQPEILRRCNSCGASTAEGSMFCPECGQALSANSSPEKAEPATESEPFAEESGVTTPEVHSDATEPSSENSPASATLQPTAPIEPLASDANAIGNEVESQPPAAASATKVERTRERLQRASSVARGAIEQNVKRADKIRHVSSAMLEEAHYDPSLRFVLVALGVFVVFLLLLLLSKVMG